MYLAIEERVSGESCLLSPTSTKLEAQRMAPIDSGRDICVASSQIQ